jgi:palmitoyltransferase
LGILLRVVRGQDCNSIRAYNSVNFLVTWGADLNLQDSDTKVTALHLATMQGNTRIVRKLLVKGIDRTIKDIQGKSALDLAVENEQKIIATMIVRTMTITYCF